MDRYELAALAAGSDPVDREAFVLERVAGKSVLDLGCVKHSAEFAAKDPDWLHRRIRAAARRCVGVDYAKAEVEKLKGLGVEVVYGDVTKPLPLEERFEVIFAGDLIEHLSNFEGFFDNCARLLAPGGSLILSTPNPFYAEGFHYAALKRRVLINPEHVCWIDPQAMLQLVGRFGWRVDDLRFVREAWRLKNFVTEGPADPYDIFTDRWARDSKLDRARRKAARLLFSVLYAPLRLLSGGCSPMVAYGDYVVVLKRA